MKKLNAQGIAHYLAIFVFVAGFAIVGTYLLVRSKAATPAKLVYVEQPTPGGATYVSLVNEDGTNKIQVSAGNDPSWSSDGTKVAFSKDGDVYTAGSDGSNPVRFISTPTGSTSLLRTLPKWSYDNRYVAFILYDISVQHKELWVVNADGTNLKRLTGDNPYLFFWSPKSNVIAYSTDFPNLSGSMVNADGTGQKVLPNANRLAEWNPWSSDGKYIMTWNSDSIGGHLYEYQVDTATSTTINIPEIATSNATSSPDYHAGFVPTTSTTQKIIYYDVNKLHTATFTSPSSVSAKIILSTYVPELNISYDGTKISYNKTNAIYTNNIDGTNEKLLVNSNFLETGFWQPTIQTSSDTVAPVVSIQSPSNGSRVNKIITVQYSATDNVNVAKLELLIDNVLVKSSDNVTSDQFAWNTSKIAKGSHTVTARAYDAVGNVGTKIISVKK